MCPRVTVKCDGYHLAILGLDESKRFNGGASAVYPLHSLKSGIAVKTLLLKQGLFGGRRSFQGAADFLGFQAAFRRRFLERDDNLFVTRQAFLRSLFRTYSFVLR
jgi:hypothetical protein